MADESWFEVTAVVRVRAASEDDAIKRITTAVTTQNVPGLYLIGEFMADVTEPPTNRPRDRAVGGLHSSKGIEQAGENP